VYIRYAFGATIYFGTPDEEAPAKNWLVRGATRLNNRKEKRLKIKKIMH
jgi:hypothetical protein